LSFDTRATARGTRLPAGRLHRLLNTITARQIRRSGQIMGGFDCLILITVGSKSGLERTNPVGWFPGPDNSWLIVAAAAGAAKNPSWYYNIAAHPDQVRIEIDHRTISVIAEQLHGAERQQAWEQVIAAQPRFAKYQVKTDRELPIIRLVSRTADQAPQA
jgi:deazaflavin-dependent oxidoreductase (nitroreductase family)